MLRSDMQRLFGRNGERGRIVIARVLLVSLVLLFLGIGYVMSADAPKVQPAKLVKVTGDVSLLTPGSAAWRQANQRERILPGTKIRTGKNSSLLLELSPRNLVHVGEKTEFALNEALVRKEIDPAQSIFFMSARSNVYDYEIEQNRGRTTLMLNGLGKSSQFEHRTPVAVAGVRGTVYGCQVVNEPAGSLPAGKGAGENVYASWSVFIGSIAVSGYGGGPMTVVVAGQTYEIGGVEVGPPGPTGESTISVYSTSLETLYTTASDGQSSNQDVNSLEMNDIGANPGGHSSPCYE